MKTYFRTTRYRVPASPEKNSGELKTQPSDSLTMYEIFAKFAQGQPVPDNSAHAGYDDLEDWTKFDFEQMQEKRQELAEKTALLTESIRRQKNDFNVRKAKEAADKKLKSKNKQEDGLPSDPAL